MERYQPLHLKLNLTSWSNLQALVKYGLVYLINFQWDNGYGKVVLHLLSENGYRTNQMVVALKIVLLLMVAITYLDGMMCPAPQHVQE